MNRSFSHWSPRYIFDRAALFFEQKRNPDHPWLTRAAIEMLGSALRLDDVALETGSGRSTLWIARHVWHLTSLESHPDWHQTVSQQVKSQNNVRLLLIEDSEAYVQAIEEIADTSLDFALIDGPNRDACALAVLPKLKPRGLLVVDNIDRYLPSTSRSPHARQMHEGCATQKWQQFADHTESWRRFWSSNGVTDTCVWVVPA